jgi:hypothetical protein
MMFRRSRLAGPDRAGTAHPGSGQGDLRAPGPGAVAVSRAFRVLIGRASPFLHRRRPSGMEK